MTRTLGDALSLSPINAALIEGRNDYPDTLIRLFSDGSAKGLQIQDGVGFQRVGLIPSKFEEFKAEVDAKKFHCRPLDQ